VGEAPRPSEARLTHPFLLEATLATVRTPEDQCRRLMNLVLPTPSVTKSMLSPSRSATMAYVHPPSLLSTKAKSCTFSDSTPRMAGSGFMSPGEGAEPKSRWWRYVSFPRLGIGPTTCSRGGDIGLTVPLSELGVGELGLARRPCGCIFDSWRYVMPFPGVGIRTNCLPTNSLESFDDGDLGLLRPPDSGKGSLWSGDPSSHIEGRTVPSSYVATPVPWGRFSSFTCPVYLTVLPSRSVQRIRLTILGGDAGRRDGGDDDASRSGDGGGDGDGGGCGSGGSNVRKLSLAANRTILLLGRADGGEAPKSASPPRQSATALADEVAPLLPPRPSSSECTLGKSSSLEKLVVLPWLRPSEPLRAPPREGTLEGLAMLLAGLPSDAARLRRDDELRRRSPPSRPR